MENLDTITGIIRFCAEECRKQRSGELSVFHMWEAYMYVSKRPAWNPVALVDKLELRDLILSLGAAVEPRVNEYGFRKTQVMIRGASKQPPDHSVVWHSITRLCENVESLSPAEFYKAFEEIHPFVDGNGRVGAIVFNYMSHTLDKPVAPPDFWRKEKWDQEG